MFDRLGRGINANTFFMGLLVFVPVTVLVYFLDLSPAVIFISSALAILPLAILIGEATDELAVRTGPAIGSLLNASFGNAIELIIGIFALRAGLIEVVKASITGSIICNLLLVLGMAVLIGGLKYKKQVFNRTAAAAGASTLYLAVIALIVPAVFFYTSPESSKAIIDDLSLAVSVLMMLTYAASLIFTLRTHNHLYAEEAAHQEAAKWSVRKSILVLLGSTIVAAVMSEMLVGAIEPLAEQYGWTDLFIGVILVAIIGNAAEHSTAIAMAYANKIEMAVQISIGSSTQIAMFVMPVLVFASMWFDGQMNLVFNPYELFAIFLSVTIANMVTADGETNWFEGWQLIVAYSIIAAIFYFVS